MKNLIIICFLPILFSCSNSFLDVEPLNELSDMTFWENETDAEKALNGCYRNFESMDNILYRDLISDNGFSQFAHDGYQIMGNGTMSATNVGINFFPYTQIRVCNNFLSKVDNCIMDEQEKEKMKAEVRFLRAYEYWKKVMFYGDVPLVTELLNTEEANVARTPKTEIFDFILQELQEAAKSLPEDNIITSGGHITKGAALALRARTALYAGLYADAKQDAKQVMEMDCYELFGADGNNPNAYFELFQPENGNNKETIFNIQYILNDFSNWLWLHILPGSTGGYSSFTIAQSLVDAYECINGKTIYEAGSGYNPEDPFNNRDPRLAQTVLYTGQVYNGGYFNSIEKEINGKENTDFYANAVGPSTGYNIRKYAKIVPADLLKNSYTDIILCRLAEVYLLYAEAAIEMNEIDNSVYDAINAVRKRVGMPDVDRSVYNGQTKMRELIRRERRVELAMEGLRLFDIQRWDIGQETMHGPLLGTRLGTMDQETGKVTWTGEHIVVEQRTFITERKYLLPIPQTEMDANPNMEQNPGY